MLLSIIIGTVLWGILIAVLSRYVTIFATPWAWFISWFVVVYCVFSIGESMADAKTEKAMLKEAKRIEGTWKSSDKNISLRAVSDDGEVVRYDGEAFLVGVYEEDGSEYVMAFYPKSNEVYINPSDYPLGESDVGKYKLKGWFSKKLVLDMENGGKSTYKRTSKEWVDYTKN